MREPQFAEADTKERCGCGSGGRWRQDGHVQCHVPYPQPEGPSAAGGLLETPRFWGTASQVGCWGALRNPQRCIYTFIKSVALWIICCIADMDCKCLVPWSLVNYVINKLLQSWPILNYSNWADFTWDKSTHQSFIFELQTPYHRFWFAYLCKPNFSQVPPNMLRWTIRTYFNYYFFLKLMRN